MALRKITAENLTTLRWINIPFGAFIRPKWIFRTSLLVAENAIYFTRL